MNNREKLENDVCRAYDALQVNQTPETERALRDAVRKLAESVALSVVNEYHDRRAKKLARRANRGRRPKRFDRMVRAAVQATERELNNQTARAPLSGPYAADLRRLYTYWRPEKWVTTRPILEIYRAARRAM